MTQMVHISFGGVLKTSFGDRLREIANELGAEIEVEGPERGDPYEFMASIDADHLEAFYDLIAGKAKEAWDQYDQHRSIPLKIDPIAEFELAGFPSSKGCPLNARFLHGSVDCDLERKKRDLPPAIATPGFVFGTAKKISKRKFR